MSRYKSVRVLARMCPCADSYEPSLLDSNVRLLKIFIFLFFSVRFDFSAHFLSRFKAVRVPMRRLILTFSDREEYKVTKNCYISIFQR